VITTLHGTDITLVGKDPSFEPVVTFSINQSDGITAVSEDLKRDTLDHFKIDKEIKVIPNFIDLDRFRKLKKEHFKKAICPNGEKLIVHTSNFRRVKRIEDAVAIFQNLRSKLSVKLLLVGDGPERPKIEGMCRECGDCEDIRFLGKLEAVEEVLSVADLFLMPSEKESFGLAALEAMACEVPVVSSNAGGLPELNIHGYSGYLSNVGDVESMTRFAMEILDDKNLPTFKKNALARASEFELSKILPKYESYYEEIIAHKSTLVV
jgi:N-acetyl-alpha-D-glucosaminyl L-malate synthase BshA